MRRFELHREVDETGISGTGIVATGVEWPDGTCAMHWDTKHTSTAVYASMEDVVAIHGHGDKTYIAWLDSKPRGGEDDELDSLCTRCFGGNYDKSRGNHCYDCGAGECNVMIPVWAVKAIRLHDEQRLEYGARCREELEYLRAMLPIPSSVSATRLRFPNGYQTREEWEADMQWSVTVDGYISTLVKAENGEEARKRAAVVLSWLKILKNGTV